MPTVQAESLKAFANEYREQYKAAGFRKQGNSYFRRVNDVSQVIAFQLGHRNFPLPDDPAAWFFDIRAAAGFPTSWRRPNSSGFLAEYVCQFRLSLAQFDATRRPGSWDLRELETARPEINKRLGEAEQLFARFDTSLKMLKYVELPKHDRTIGLMEMNRWEAITIRVERGEMDIAQRQLDYHVTSHTLNRSHFRHLTEYAEEHGLTVIQEGVTLWPPEPPAPAPAR